jgi:hypothetical protein
MNTRGMKGLVLVALALLGGAACLARSGASVPEPSRAPVTAVNVVVPAPASSPVSAAAPAAAHVERAPVSPELRPLFDALGRDAIGERAKAGILAFQADVDARGLSARFEDSALVRAWKAQPASALVDIETLLARLDTKEHWALKTQLLRAAGLVGGDRDVVQTIASEAMRDATAVAWRARDVDDVSPYIPMVSEAVRTMIKAADSPDAAISAALDAMAAHGDPRTQAGIRAALEVAYPTRRGVIDLAMTQRGIAEPEAVIGRQVLAAQH